MSIYLCFLSFIAFMGCENTGELLIKLNMDTGSEHLNPFRTNSIQFLNVTVSTGSETLSYTARYESPGKINLGDLDVGSYSRVILKGNSIDGVLIAYGAVDLSKEISGDGKIEVEIPFRYPLIYLGGAPELYSFHPFKEVYENGFPRVGLGAPTDNTTAVAISPDGKYIFAATYHENGDNSTATIFALSTMNHENKRETTIPADGPIDKITFNAEGNLAAMYAPGGSKVRLLNVTDYLDTQGDVTAFAELSIPTPQEIVWTTNNQIAILQSLPFTYNSCDNPPNSTLNLINVPDDLQHGMNLPIELSIPLDNYTSSITTDMETSRIFLAHPCQNEVTMNMAGESSVNTLLSPTNLSPCRIPVQLLSDTEFLYATCHTNDDTVSQTWSPAKLVLQRISLSAPTQQNMNRPVVLDYPAEAFNFAITEVGTGGEPVGTQIQLMQKTISVLPLQISLAVDGDKIALLSEGYYASPELNITGSNTRIPATQRKSRSVIIVDPNSATVTRRFRAACYSVDGMLDYTLPTSGLTGLDCAPLSGVDIPVQEFIPVSIAAVYGK